MSLETAFADGHTLDIGPWVEPDEPMQGLLFETISAVRIDGRDYAVLRLIGITRDELEYAYDHSVGELLGRLKAAGVYPNTATQRASLV
jgi:hypothetical protein